MFLRVCREDVLEVISYLRDVKEPFKFSVTNHTYKLESSRGNYFNTDSKIPFHELSFIKSVASHVKKNNIMDNIPNDYKYDKKEGKYIYDNIKYFDYKPHIKSKKYTDDIYELDINAAYWETALKLGIISKEIYKKGLRKHKKTRLASLGSLAKRTIVFNFNGKKMSRNPKKELPKETEYLWFKICEKLGETMYRASKACGKGFIFYWVDGIYVKGLEAAEKVFECFEKDGYDCKVMRIRWVDVNVEQKEIWVSDGMVSKESVSHLGYQFPNRQQKILPLTEKSNFKHKSIFYRGAIYEIGKPIIGGKIELWKSKKTKVIAKLENCCLIKNRVFPLTNPKFKKEVTWKKK